MDQWIAFALLVSALMLMQIRKISDAVYLLSFQSALLALLSVYMWTQTGLSHLLIAAFLTLVVKAAAIPLILLYTIKKIDIKREAERFTGKYTSLLLGLALSVAGFYVTSRMQVPDTELGRSFFPVSIIMIFLGMLVMIDQKKAIMQGIGFIMIENGILLTAQSVSYGMPLLVELGIFFDMLVSVIVIGILSFRIQETFESLNTEKMKNLKG